MTEQEDLAQVFAGHGTVQKAHLEDARKVLEAGYRLPVIPENVREEIETIIDKALMADIVDGRFGSAPYAKEILNLIAPLIEQAKQEEKKRVLSILEKEYPAITTWQCWKSLKDRG